MSSLRVQVEGVGVWSPAVADFAALRGLLQGDAIAATAARPPGTALSPNERRRAPESVLVAMEVAAQAVAMSGRAADTLACVFASAYGDQATTDYMCRVLARAPAELSPTRFHNSVHNASAGYWTIAANCRAPSSAVCAGHASFGAGLLEAAVQACADDRAVLLVCSDTAGIGPLGELIGCTRPFGSALVLSPCRDIGAPAWMLATVAQTPSHAPLPQTCTAWMHDNPSAASLPLLALLARGGGECVLALSDRSGLRVEMEMVA
ncbi:MAG TPA: beta-ketoacyl synthase chain length factor [Dyella sp.]|uniref:beta-ketoacyl synthase chain length factor n=1 Tax=Dyella sp. TaxID=1869338 RepID=UPI002CB2B801|nr:beta-ketoacyl synthase chain length factor [Dyella sp.]HTV86231.1 beta-ketoacyl synthase chain length factor [Dyella sp.]